MKLTTKFIIFENENEIYRYLFNFWGVDVNAKRCKRTWEDGNYKFDSDAQFLIYDNDSNTDKWTNEISLVDLNPTDNPNSITITVYKYEGVLLTFYDCNNSGSVYKNVANKLTQQ